jgi:hypothetical protein
LQVFAEPFAQGLTQEIFDLTVYATKLERCEPLELGTQLRIEP